MYPSSKFDCLAQHKLSRRLPARKLQYPRHIGKNRSPCGESLSCQPAQAHEIWMAHHPAGKQARFGDHPPAPVPPRNLVFALDFHDRSEEHTSELQSLMRISYAVFCLKKKTHTKSKSYIK